MSTPSGKPFDPFDLSPYAPKRARERAASDQNDKKEDTAGVVLPYAPRAALPLAEGAAPAVPHPLDLDSIDKEPAAPATSVPQESLAEEPHANAVESAAPVSEVDPALERLEASLQWIQREGSAARLPRAASLPPVGGLRAPAPEDLRPRGEQYINGVRVPPSLAPERLRPPPMRERRDSLRAPMRVLLAAVIAAPVAYYFSVGGFSSRTGGEPQSGLTSLATRMVASTEFPIPKDKVPPSEAEDYNTMVSSRNKLVALPPAPAAKVAPPVIETPAPTSVTPAPASPAVQQPAPAPKAMREMDPGSIRLLMQQGEQFLASGDVFTARTVFQRAAEAGNAAAALALGATFDPEVLAKMGARGVSADVEKARQWYEKAKAYGSSEAPRRLEALANR
jgi:hypothetical protein